MLHRLFNFRKAPVSKRHNMGINVITRHSNLVKMYKQLRKIGVSNTWIHTQKRKTPGILKESV